MEENKQNQNLILKATCIFFSVISKWKMLILIAFMCGMACDFYYTFSYKPQYSASMQVALVQGENTYSQLEEARAYVKTLTYILNGQVAKDYVMEKSGIDELSMTCNISSQDETNIVNIQVLAPTKQEAYYSLKYLTKWYADNMNQYNFTYQLDVMERTPISEFPVVSNDHFSNFKKGFIISVVVLIIFIILFEYLKDTIKSPEDVQNRLDSRLFVKIPKEKKPGSKKFWRKKKSAILITSLKTSFYYRESIKKLRNRFEESAKRHNYKTLLITSSLENEGKSSLAANLALSLVKNGHKVLLIDGDMRKPSLYKIFDIKIDKSLNNYLSGNETWQSQVMLLPKNNLHLLCAAKNFDEAESLISSEKMKLLIDESKKMYDFVIVDSSPAYDINEPLIINDLVDASLLVVRQDYASSKIINETISRLVNANNNLIGCIYNARIVDIAKTKKVYGYHYGYNRYRKSQRRV